MRNFQCNVLKAKKRKAKTFPIASYDIETETQSGFNEFILGGFIDEKGKYKSFTDKDKMIDYMLAHTTKDTKIYATSNKFDYSALFKHKDEFMKGQPNLRGGLLMHAQYGHMHFYDTLSYIKTSVEKLGEMLNKPKLKINLGKNRFMMSKYEMRKLITYNKRDCEITREFMIGFQELLNSMGGQLGQTIGSCAMDLYKRKFLKKPIRHEYVKDCKFKDGTTVTQLIFKAYHGGRTEMFKRGYSEETYYRYDFNSLYPSVMLKEYPKPSSAIISERLDGNLNEDTIHKFEGICECEVVCPFMYYPVLSIYVNNKLCFPIGRFKGVFTYVELREFIKQGGKILKIYKTITYTQKIRPFKDWVIKNYNQRLKFASENNVVYKEIMKLYLNNLYGKFGQHNIKTIEFFNAKERNDELLKQDGIVWDDESEFGFRETPKETHQTFIIPIFAVYTTAYARLKLFKALKNLKGIYCDTDSIFSLKLIKTSNKLGDLKLEGTTKGINIVKQKHYKVIDKDTGKETWKIKGLSLSKNVFDREKQFNDSISGVAIQQDRILGIKEAMRRGKKINELVHVTKKFDLKDTKRTWIKAYSKDTMIDSLPLIIGFSSLSELELFYSQL